MDALRKLQLELVNYCNYRCPLCRTLRKDDVRRRKLELFELKKVVQSLPERLENIALYGTRGEPFLHPQLEAATELLKQKTGAFIDISTNGSLVDQTRARRILDAGLDRIIFAIDGLSEVSYQSYRVGGTLEEVVNNLRYLCVLKKKGGYKTKIIAQWIPMKTNEKEQDQLESMARDWGVDEVRIKHSHSVQRSSLFRTKGIGSQRANSGIISCSFGLDKLYIDPNADCYPCCYAEGRPDLHLGNALEQPIEKIWFSRQAVAIRTALRAHEKYHPFCVDTCKHRSPRKKQRLRIVT
ncbi:MAG: radical SAM protein [Myxococcota bacterium]|nr:radical SAM protein [Myxococcota bacterium]